VIRDKSIVGGRKNQLAEEFANKLKGVEYVEVGAGDRYHLAQAAAVVTPGT